jgi:phosphatidate cytidylyltransferase
MNALAQSLNVYVGVLQVLAGMVAALVIGTVVRLTLLKGKDAETKRKKIGSLIAWWILTLFFGAAALLGPSAGIVLIGIISGLGLREFLQITDDRFHEKPLRVIAYVALPVHYLIILLRWHEAFWMFIPAVVFLLLPLKLIVTGQTEGYIQKASTVTWGLILTVYAFSHAALLLSLPEDINPAGGPVGLFLYLVILTELNDIAQALWGRKFGRHKVVPAVSPGKSWEGLILGMLTTVITAILLSPLLTPLPGGAETVRDQTPGPDVLLPALAGVLIAAGGFFGDLNMSAVKRDLGIKDAGHLIPGQGGVLDRIDSLTYTAPLFFYFIYFLSA